MPKKSTRIGDPNLTLKNEGTFGGKSSGVKSFEHSKELKDLAFELSTKGVKGRSKTKSSRRSLPKGL